MAERAFLAEARAALGRMHEEVVTTATVQDSSEDADYTFTNRELARDRERRAEALVSEEGQQAVSEETGSAPLPDDIRAELHESIGAIETR